MLSKLLRFALAKRPFAPGFTVVITERIVVLKNIIRWSALIAVFLTGCSGPQLPTGSQSTSTVTQETRLHMSVQSIATSSPTQAQIDAAIDEAKSKIAKAKKITAPPDLTRYTAVKFSREKAFGNSQEVSIQGRKASTVEVSEHSRKRAKGRYSAQSWSGITDGQSTLWFYVDENGNTQYLEIDTPTGIFTYGHDEITQIFGGEVNIPDVYNALSTWINGNPVLIAQWIQIFDSIDQIATQFGADAQNFARFGESIYMWVTNNFFPWYLQWWRQAMQVTIIAWLVGLVVTLLYWGWIILL